MLGHEPPTHRRSTTAVRCPSWAMCHARYVPFTTAEDEHVHPFRLNHDTLLAGTVFDMPERLCGLTIAWSRLA